MIHELSGDILLSGAKGIAQGIAPNDDFMHGLALQLRERMPAMYKDFRHYCHSRHPKPGELWTWMSSDGRYLVNLFTRDGAYDHGSKPGHATLSHVNHALHALRGFIRKEKPASIALPKLACGLGGLDWNDVKPLIEKQLGDLDIPVYVYATYHKGVKANEPK
ncbi:MAG: Appr-1-p processing protein [Nitrosomonadales bacterium]|nr:Appr-1-p processing protein [Nitrosomonadales bacterium]